MSTETRLETLRSSAAFGRGEAGFTLIELMQVLLIIAILLAIAIPTFLGVANSAGDRAAQSNLTNGLTEAKALYQNGATYAPSGTAIATTALSSSAPEFSWTTGGCDATHANCLSEQVVDTSVAGDGQGMILAAYSAKTQSCWYSLDLESTPTSFTDAGKVAFKTTGVVPTSTAGAFTAGVFYAQKKNAVTSTNCNANWAATQGAFGWGLSYASPGAA